MLPSTDTVRTTMERAQTVIICSFANLYGWPDFSSGLVRGCSIQVSVCEETATEKECEAKIPSHTEGYPIIFHNGNELRIILPIADICVGINCFGG
jgi:hypothetical protein